MPIQDHNQNNSYPSHPRLVGAINLLSVPVLKRARLMVCSAGSATTLTRILIDHLCRCSGWGMSVFHRIRPQRCIVGVYQQFVGMQLLIIELVRANTSGSRLCSVFMFVNFRKEVSYPRYNSTMRSLGESTQ